MSLLKNGNVIGGISKALLSKIGFSDLNTKSQNLCDAINELADMIYPVGSIYMSVNNTDPSLLFGGTWEAWGSGKVPVGVDANDTAFDTVEETGGTKSESYTPAGSNTKMAVTMNAVELTHSGGAVQSHTLTVNEIPSHTHPANNFIIKNTGGSAYAASSGSYKVAYWTDSTVTTNARGGGKGHSHSLTQPSKHSFTPTAKTYTNPTFTGTKATINHLQPYITCYMWKRVA